MHGAANLARVSFVHCLAVLTKEVLSKTLPAGFEEIMLQMVAPRCAALLPSLQCNSKKQFKKGGTSDFPLGSLYGELLLDPVSCCGMTGCGLALTEDLYSHI